MAANNPVALPLMLTITSLVFAGYNWDSTPESLPVWWSADAVPLVYVPRWVALLAFPFLQLVLPYIMYQIACRDEKLQAQSGESAYAVANIIALPAVLLFSVYALVYLPVAMSDDLYFLPRMFTTNLAVWALLWLGYNLQYVEPNSSIGVPVFAPLTEKDLWARSHHRGAVVLMVFGVILFVFGLACPIGEAYMVVTAVLWLGAYALAVLDSYMLSDANAPTTTTTTTTTRTTTLARPLLSRSPQLQQP